MSKIVNKNKFLRIIAKFLENNLLKIYIQNRFKIKKFNRINRLQKQIV